MNQTGNTLIGRSSSHFTRLTRIFAAELGVPYELQVVRDLLSAEVVDYGGNPALKLPSLRTPAGIWFGALNVCRELARQAGGGRRIVWPEDLVQPLPANLQELTTQAMATGVALIMSRAKDAVELSPHQVKMKASLHNSLAWLEENLHAALAALPADRDLSTLEVSLFCLVTHLEWRGVAPIAPYPRLEQFCQVFGARPSAAATPYRFDP